MTDETTTIEMIAGATTKTGMTATTATAMTATGMTETAMTVIGGIIATVPIAIGPL